MAADAIVLVAGAINTDLVATVDRAPEAGETVTGRGFAVHGGGKGANQAVAVDRSGVATVLIGANGNDDFGSARRADIETEGIDKSWIRTTDEAASGVAQITVETGGENRIAYVPGATVTITADHALAAVAATTPTVLLAPNEIPAPALAALVARAREMGVTTILNAAPDPELAIPLLPNVDILIANRGEAIAMAGVGDRADVATIAAALASLGPTRIVITVGGDGAFGVDEGESFTVASPAVAVVDTTGAGDTFCGALAASLARAASFREAVEYAVVAGSLSVTRAGAQSSIPTRTEIEAALGRG